MRNAVRELIDHGNPYLCAAILRFTSLSMQQVRSLLRKTGSVDKTLLVYHTMCVKGLAPEAALAAVEAQGPGWQPIETAPRNGTEVLATGFDFGVGPSRHVMVAAYEGWLWTDTHNHEAPYLTHWMPLPEPPKEV